MASRLVGLQTCRINEWINGWFAATGVQALAKAITADCIAVNTNFAVGLSISCRADELTGK